MCARSSLCTEAKSTRWSPPDGCVAVSMNGGMPRSPTRGAFACPINLRFAAVQPGDSHHRQLATNTGATSWGSAWERTARLRSGAAVIPPVWM